jgi:hypothetical protein
MRPSIAAVASLLLSVSGCSSPSSPPAPPSPGGGGNVPGSGSGSGNSGAPTPAPYPPGPYSSGIGGILPEVRGAGYRLSAHETDSRNLPWDPDIDVAEYHQRPECTCLVVSVAATWCGECVQEQPLLIQGVASDPGFCVLGVLQDGLQGGQEVLATEEDVFNWTQQFHQNFYVIQGNQGTGWGLITGHGTGSSVPLPFSLIVKPDTMTVVGEVLGWRADIHDYATGLCAQ